MTLMETERGQLIRRKLPPRLLNLTDIQVRYLNDPRRFLVVSAGRRSRKTLISKRKLFYRAVASPYKRYFAGAPTHSQAKSIFWNDLKRYFYYYTIGKPSETELLIRLKNGTEVQVIGLDKSERIEGQPWDGAIITEFPNLKSGAWDEHIRPVFSDTNGWCILDGVPEGRNHYYDRALYAAGGLIPVTEPLIGAYSENPDDPDWAFYTWFSSDVLSEGEIRGTRASMDERTFRQEYEGSFENYEGTLYYTFNRSVNVNDSIAAYRREEPLYLTCDFNKKPMVWEVGQTRQIDGSRALLLVDELSISYHAKTEINARQFIDRFKNHQNRTVYVHGDAANQWDSTVSYVTDYKIIEDLLRSAGWKVYMAIKPKNPSVNNRINIGCSLLRSVDGKVRLYASSKCVRWINDMERVVSDGKGGKDKDDEQLTHASDASDYLVWDLFAQEFFGAGARNL